MAIRIGTNTNDTLFGTDFADYILGRDGDDLLDAGTGNDTVLGGNGRDTLIGGEGNDSLSGENGDDILFGGAGDDTLLGQDGNDLFVWNPGDGSDTMTGGTGVDTVVVNGDGGGDTFGLTAGGTDLLFVGAAFRLNLFQIEAIEVYGQDGNDLFQVGDVGRTPLQQIYFEGGGGKDTLDGSAATVALIAAGGVGQDSLVGGLANDTFQGGIGADVLAGGGGNDWLDGGTQADRLIWSSGDGNDTLIGGDGADVADLRGHGGDDLFSLNALGPNAVFDAATPGATLDIREIETIEVSGDDGDDVLTVGDLSGSSVKHVFFSGGAGNDILVGVDAMRKLNADGGSDDDTLIGGAAADTLTGGAGNDVVLGGGGADLLSGETGDDQINGDGGADHLFGGTGDDTISGGAGADVIDGGGGEDLIWGDGGADVFIYGADQLSNGVAEGDLIVDYSAAQGDVVDLPDAEASVSSSFVLDGNLVVMLTGSDSDLIEFVNITNLSDIVFV